MRIVLFDNGSFVQWVIPLANSLSLSNEIVLIIPDTTNNDFIDQISPKINLQTFKQTRISNPHSILITAEIIRNISKYNPDIIHIQSHGGLWFSLLSSFLRKYKIINEVHDITPHIGDERSKNKGYSIATYFGKKFTNHFIVHGKNLKKQMMDEYSLEEDKISIVPLGNLSIYQKSDSIIYEEEPNTVLFFGRIWPYKGLEYLIKSEPLISSFIPNLNIVIAGEGESFERYNKMIKNSSSFTIKNYRVSNDELSELFQKAAVVVLPYIEATQSGIITIAFAYGKPVVITDVGSLAEVVEDGETGYVVPPRSSYELSRAIIKILQNKKLRKKMGKKAFASSQSIISWETISKKSLKTYRMALENQ